MRVIRVHEFGAPEVLRSEEAEAPDPGPGEVVVAVERAGITYGDVIVRSGGYPFPLPYVPGLEVGGRVAALGPGVDGFTVGQRVVATTVGNAGGYAERARADAARTFAVPDALPLDRAVAVFQAGAVAGGMLAAMRVRAGESVLVTAAAGRIGSLLVQLARAAGADPVIGSVGGPGKVAAARSFGADPVVDHDAAGWPALVCDATGGRGADVVLDAIGGAVGSAAFDAAADGGRIGLYGYASGAWTTLDARQIARRGLAVVGPLGIALAEPAADQRDHAERVLAAAADGRITPRIHATYPLADAARAHGELSARRTVGAVLLAP